MICQKKADLKILKSVEICQARPNNGQLVELNLSKGSFVFLTDYHHVFSVLSSREVFCVDLSYQQRFEIYALRKHVNLLCV